MGVAFCVVMALGWAWVLIRNPKHSLSIEDGRIRWSFGKGRYARRGDVDLGDICELHIERDQSPPLWRNAAPVPPTVFLRMKDDRNLEIPLDCIPNLESFKRALLEGHPSIRLIERTVAAPTPMQEERVHPVASAFGTELSPRLSKAIAVLYVILGGMTVLWFAAQFVRQGKSLLGFACFGYSLLLTGVSLGYLLRPGTYRIYMLLFAVVTVLVSMFGFGAAFLLPSPYDIAGVLFFLFLGATSVCGYSVFSGATTR